MDGDREVEVIRINLSPIRGDVKTELSVSGSTVTVDNVDYDLSLLEDGASAEHGILGAVTRSGNDYECTIRLTHGKNAPFEARFPEPVELNGNYEYDFGGVE